MLSVDVDDSWDTEEPTLVISHDRITIPCIKEGGIVATKLSQADYHEACNEYAGYCTTCKAVTNESGVEPDAEEYMCDECGEFTVMGIEQALILDYLEITDAAAEWEPHG